MNETWNQKQRQGWLADYETAKGQLETLLWQETQSRPDEIDDLQTQLSALWDAYRDAIPRLPIARCPFTDAVVHHSCDNAGLDGLWWQYETAVRPTEDLPPTFWALTGAVAITPPVETTSFLCKPGPGAPYVLPELLGQPPVKGVLYAFPVGRHTAYALTYFVELPGLSLARPNTWGTGVHTWIDGDGQLRWDEADDDEETWDFDLRPWLAEGKLLWIAPGDAGMALRSGLTGCPYVNLDGEHRPQYVQFGEVTTW